MASPGSIRTGCLANKRRATLPILFRLGDIVARLSASLAKQDNLDGFNQYKHIQKQAIVLDVV